MLCRARTLVRLRSLLLRFRRVLCGRERSLHRRLPLEVGELGRLGLGLSHQPRLLRMTRSFSCLGLGRRRGLGLLCRLLLCLAHLIVLCLQRPLCARELILRTFEHVVKLRHALGRELDAIAQLLLRLLKLRLRTAESDRDRRYLLVRLRCLLRGCGLRVERL